MNVIKIECLVVKTQIRGKTIIVVIRWPNPYLRLSARYRKITFKNGISSEFEPILKFRAKFRVSSRVFNLEQNFDFRADFKISSGTLIFKQNLKFRAEFWFSSRYQNFEPNFDFWAGFEISSRILIRANYRRASDGIIERFLKLWPQISTSQILRFRFTWRYPWLKNPGNPSPKKLLEALAWLNSLTWKFGLEIFTYFRKFLILKVQKYSVELSKSEFWGV